MTFVRCVLAISYFSIYQVDGANILTIAAIPSVSHSKMFIKLSKELASKGHNVDVVSHYPSTDNIEGYNDISIKECINISTDMFTIDHITSLRGALFVKSIIFTIGVPACEGSFQSPQLQQLKLTKKKYDLLITETFSSHCMLAWAWHFDVPSVLISTSYPFPWANDLFGNPDNPSYVPTYFVEYPSNMSFSQRFWNTWSYVKTKFVFQRNRERAEDHIAKKFFGENMPPLEELAYKSSLMLTNTHFSIHGARTLVPNVVEVAGLHLESPKPLNQYFDKLLTTNLSGIIYFTMGSIVRCDTFPVQTLGALLEAFSQIPYKIIWGAEWEQFPKSLQIPNNVVFETWLPQVDILCDPRVKLFITHGGMMSTQESVYCGVPLLGIPIFADQKHNIKYAEYSGYALGIDDFEYHSFLEALKELLYNQSYKNNAEKMSKEFRDRPMSALDTAVYWTEYVIRHKGAPRLQSHARFLTWYQYHLLDVVLVMVVAPFVFICLLILSSKLFVSKRETHRKFKSN